jgi:hypothetical protein
LKSAGSACWYGSSLRKRTTENTKAAFRPIQQQQQQQNEDQGGNNDCHQSLQVVKIETARWHSMPEPVRYIIAGVGTSTPGA